MCTLLVGLLGITVVGVGDWPAWLRIAITTNPAASVVLRPVGVAARHS